MRSSLGIGISIGAFVTFRAKLYKATETDNSFRSKVRSLCECGTQPKQSIVCPACQKNYGASWDKVPLRGYEYLKGEFLPFTQEEWENAAKVESSKEFDPIAWVPLKTLVMDFHLSEPYYVSLDDGALTPEQKAFKLTVEILGEQDRALLSYASFRGIQKRVAIVADAKRGILILYEVQALRHMDPLMITTPVTEAERAMLLAMLKEKQTDEINFPEPEDGRKKLVEAKLEELQHPVVATAVQAPADLTIVPIKEERPTETLEAQLVASLQQARRRKEGQ